ncbi:hypothetical protein L4D06_23755 [Enterovibrio makurazakiensis]|uniref:hypothetical protein n=1 Tax=Enterovibrio makurazakiensis TaxID=2910232 RepID=UPI003D1D835D
MKMLTNRWKEWATLMALSFLLGCTENSVLDYQPETDAPTQYYAQVEIKLTAPFDYHSDIRDIAFTTPFSLKPLQRAESNEKSAQVTIYGASFSAIQGDEEPFFSWIDEGLRLKRKGDALFSFEVSKEQSAIASKMTNTAMLGYMKDLHKHGAMRSLSMLPPRIGLDVGSTVTELFSSGFQTTYRVELATEQRIRVGFSGSNPNADPAILDQESTLGSNQIVLPSDNIVGWADYEPKTGKLIQLRATFEITVDESKYEYIQGVVLVSNEPIMEQEDKLRRFKNPLAKQSKLQKQAMEAIPINFNQAIEYSVDEHTYEWGATAFNIVATQKGFFPPILSNYQFLDKHGQHIEQHFFVDDYRFYRAYSDRAKFGDSDDFDDDNYIWLSEPQESKVSPSYLQLSYTPTNYRKHTQIIPIEEGKVTFTHPEFTLVGELQRYDTVWSFTLTELADSNVAYYSFANKDEKVRVSDFKWIEPKKEEDANIDLIGAIPSVWQHATLGKRTFQYVIWFDKEPAEGIPFTWYEKPVTQTVKIPLSQAVRSVKNQAPIETIYDRNAITGKHSYPTLFITPHQVHLSIKPEMVKLCNLDVVTGVYRGSDTRWLVEDDVRCNAKSGLCRYPLTAYKGSVQFFYDEKVQVSLACSTGNPSPLMKGKDYKQITPWLIELKGVYSELDWEAASKRLQAYDQDDKVLQWVKTADNADFDMPFLKAWGDINSVKDTTLGQSELLIDQLVEFAPTPE